MSSLSHYRWTNIPFPLHGLFGFLVEELSPNAKYTQPDEVPLGLLIIKLTVKTSFKSFTGNKNIFSFPFSKIK